jgi:hypothetical protein
MVATGGKSNVSNRCIGAAQGGAVTVRNGSLLPILVSKWWSAFNPYAFEKPLQRFSSR